MFSPNPIHYCAAVRRGERAGQFQEDKSMRDDMGDGNGR